MNAISSLVTVRPKRALVNNHSLTTTRPRRSLTQNHSLVTARI
ncbi:hypothetical protein [Mycobacterium aquaticum]|nr:hypothetical protein [Mycobacterium aquaticum]